MSLRKALTQFAVGAVALLLPSPALAARTSSAGIDLSQLGHNSGSVPWNILVLLTVLTLLPAIVLSMTPQERSRPDILNARRRQRIARGSGRTVTEVNDLLQRFNQMRKLMKSAGKMKRKLKELQRLHR